VQAGDRVLAAVRKEHIGLRAPALNGGGATGQVMPGQASPGQASPGQASPGQASPGQVLPGQIRASSFLGLVDEYIIAVGNVEMRAIQPATGAGSGDPIEVAIQPDHCIVLAEGDEAAPH